MARYVLAFLAAAVLCTTVLAQEVNPAHKGKDGEWKYKYSVYDSSSQRYRPVRDCWHGMWEMAPASHAMHEKRC
jgi:hypothetical protein